MDTVPAFPSAEKGKEKTILLVANHKVCYTSEFAAIALQRMGHNVKLFTPSQDAPENWMRVGPDLDAVDLVKTHGAGADLFLMVESSTGTPILPRRIEEVDIPTAYWVYDNYLNFRWNKEVVALFDYGFFAQLGRMRLAEKYGARNLTWLPFAADEVFHRNFHVERDIDIGYVGSITGQKKKYFAELEKSGLRVRTNERFYTYEEIGRFYSRCKLVYNILARRDVNVRTFEAPCAGALVVNQREIDMGCHSIFTEGQNMMFHDFTDAPAVCRRLLEDDSGRERMAGAAEKLILSGHTYRHRMQKVIDVCSAGVTDERWKRGSTFAAPLAESLTCSHRDFGWKKRAREKFIEAVRRSPVGVARSLVKYLLFRIFEKAEKIRWSFGKAPV